MQVRGPWVAGSYYNDERSPESFTEDGWLKTGDVATADAEGYIRLLDRTKDLIKSGGEWISSVELENEIMAHPDVAEAAVIGVASAKWGERAMACVVVAEGAPLNADEVREWRDGRGKARHGTTRQCKSRQGNAIDLEFIVPREVQ